MKLHKREFSKVFIMINLRGVQHDRSFRGEIKISYKIQSGKSFFFIRVERGEAVKSKGRQISCKEIIFSAKSRE